MSSVEASGVPCDEGASELLTKAEPFKAWLAMVGWERVEETVDPEQAIDRALETYLKTAFRLRRSEAPFTSPTRQA